MADEYDGRVTIGTEMDLSGFEKGSEKLRASVSSLVQAIGGMSGTLEQAFGKQIKVPEPELPDKEDMELPQPDPVTPEIDTTAFDAGVERIEQDMERLTEAVGEEVPEPEPVEPKLESAQFEKQADKMQTDFNRVVGEINRMVSGSLQGFQSTTAVLAFNNKLELTAEKVEEAREKLQEFAEQQIPTDQYAEATASIEKIEAELDKLHEKQARMVMLGEDRPSKQWEDTNAKLEDANRRLNNYVESLRYMEEKGVTGGSVWDEMTEKYNAARQEVEQYEAQLQKLGEGGEAHSKKWRNIELQIKEAEAELENYKAQESNLRESGAAFIDPKATEQYETMLEQIEQAAQAIETNTGLINKEKIEQKEYNVLLAQEKVAHASNAVTRQIALRQLQKAQNELAAVANKSVTPKPDPAAGSAWNRFSSTISKITLGARGAADSIKGMGGKAVKTAISGVKSLASKFTGLFSSIKNNGKGSVDALFKKITSLKSALISRINRTFVSSVFDQVKESFNELAKFDGRFDKSVSNFKNKTAELGANIMAGLGGIIRQIEPIITRVIDAASTAVTKLNAVISSIRGESVMQVAAKRTDSYADSLRDAGKAAKEDQKAQEALAETLTSIDEIHKLDAPKDSTSSSDTAADAEKTIYENVPVDSILGSMSEFGKNISQRIIDGIKNGNWFDAGHAISEGLNTIVSAIDKKILGAREAVLKKTRDIADLLNGLVDGFNATALGQTIGDAINLALDTAYEFLERFDFSKLGVRTVEGLNGLVDRLDPEGLGRTIGSALNAAIDWAYEVFTGFKWDEFGAKLATNLNAFVKKVDWGKAAKMLSAGIVGVINSIASFLETADWEAIGESIITFLKNVDWAGVAKALFRAIGAAIGGVAGLMKGIFNALIDTGEKWGEKLFEKYGDEFNAAGGSIADGILAGLKAVFKDIKSWCKKNIFDPFIKGFKKAFGIASPSKEMKPYGGYVGEGILEGIKGIFSNITQWVKEHIFEPFKKAFTAAFNIVGGVANSLLESGKSIASGLKNGIDKGWNTITTFFSKKNDEMRVESTNLADSATSGFNDTEKFKKAGQNAADAVSTALKSSDYTAAGKEIISDIGAGITDQRTWDDKVGGPVMTRASWIENGFRGGNYAGAGESVVAGVGSGIVNNYDSYVGGVVIERAKWMANGFANNDGYYQAGKDSLSSYINGMVDYVNEHGQGTSALMAALQGQRMNESSRTYGGPLMQTADTIRTIASDVKEIDDTEIKIDADGAVSTLDRVADKLSTVAQIFRDIGKTFADLASVPVPAVAMGAITPAQTRVLDYGDSSNGMSANLIERLITRIEELEEAVANRPIRLESKVEIEKREIGRALAEYSSSGDRVTNGNGGATRW